MIYTGYFAQLRNIPQNIIPISICAQVPKWYTGLQHKKLAPKYGFFTEWKKNQDNDYYIEHYNKEVLSGLNANDIVSELYGLLPEESKGLDIVLVCYEKSTDFCHRHLVADWLRQNGIACAEWEKT